MFSDVFALVCIVSVEDVRDGYMLVFWATTCYIFFVDNENIKLKDSDVYRWGHARKYINKI